MTPVDPRDFRPRAHGDRRQGPRRLEEVRLHYAEQGLLAAACAYVDARRHQRPTAMDKLWLAVGEYRAAVTGLGKDRGDDAQIDLEHGRGQEQDELGFSGWCAGPSMVDIDVAGERL
jgi:hypothetical protein